MEAIPLRLLLNKPHLCSLTGHKFILFKLVSLRVGTADGGTVVKAPRYKSEGRWFDSRWCHWNFSLT
jgi:hypothetical protein